MCEDKDVCFTTEDTEHTELNSVFSVSSVVIKILPRQLNLQLDSRLQCIEYANKRIDCNIARITLQT